MPPQKLGPISKYRNRPSSIQERLYFSPTNCAESPFWSTGMQNIPCMGLWPQMNKVLLLLLLSLNLPHSFFSPCMLCINIKTLFNGFLTKGLSESGNLAQFLESWREETWLSVQPSCYWTIAAVFCAPPEPKIQQVECFWWIRARSRVNTERFLSNLPNDFCDKMGRGCGFLCACYES